MATLDLQSFRDVSLAHALRYGAVLSAGAGALIFGSLWYNPEIWYNDYPPEVKAAHGPMSERAKREAAALAVPFALLLLGIPTYSTLRLRRRSGGRLPFAAAFANTFLVASVFNLFDLFAVDLLLMKRPPRGFIVPGTEDLMRRYHRFDRHVKGAIKGFGLSAALGVLVGLLLSRG